MAITLARSSAWPPSTLGLLATGVRSGFPDSSPHQGEDEADLETNNTSMTRGITYPATDVSCADTTDACCSADDAGLSTYWSPFCTNEISAPGAIALLSREDL